MNIVFQDALSEAMYVATRHSNPATRDYFKDNFENHLWGYAPKPNLNRKEVDPAAYSWECMISGNRNDLVEPDDTENLAAWEFTWVIYKVRADRYNKLTAGLIEYPDGENKTHYMTGGLVNHAATAGAEPDWSIHT